MGTARSGRAAAKTRRRAQARAGPAPLPRREFARALRLGLGRARIDVRRHGLAGREDLLLAVCVRNPTRDPQVEEGLADWLLAIAREGGATAAVRRVVLAAASQPIVRRNDRQQIASILSRWAHEGDALAARALLRMVDVQVPCDHLAGSALWGLGESAWRRVIRSYGSRWDQARRIDWSWIVYCARAAVGARRTLAVLSAETEGRDHLQPLAEPRPLFRRFLSFLWTCLTGVRGH